MPKAARITDPCVHPSARLSTGSPDTIIGNLPASRHGDHSLGCTVPIPVPPHIGGTLMKCSRKVFINFWPAARVGDLLACPAPGPVGPPGGPKHFAKEYEIVTDDDVPSLVYVSTRNGDWDKDQSRAQVDPGNVAGGHDYDVPEDGSGAPPPSPPPGPTTVVSGTSGNPASNPIGGNVTSSDALGQSSGGAAGSPSGGTNKAGVSTPGGSPAPASSLGPPGGGGAAAYFDIKSKLLTVSQVADANEMIQFSFDVLFGCRFYMPILLFGVDSVRDGCATVFIGG